jgi:hypothetical protein
VRQPGIVTAREPRYDPSLPKRADDPMRPVPEISAPQQKILDAIAWMNSIGIAEPEQVAVAFLAGYTYGAGAFNNLRGSLRTKGLVEYRGSRIRLTEEGLHASRWPGEPLTNEELHRRVMDILPGPEQKLLRVLLDCFPRALTNEELAEKSGYAVDSGGFNNPKGRLRSLGLIDYPQPRHAVAAALLFPEYE